VVGFEGDVYYQNAETSFAQSGRPSWFSTSGSETFTGSVKQGTNGSFRGRIGALVTPSTLVYATGGLAVGEISGSFSYLACTTSPCSSGTSVFGATSWNETRIGGTAGAGVETELFPGWKGRLEYRYTDFGSITKDVALSNNSAGARRRSAATSRISRRRRPATASWSASASISAKLERCLTETKALLAQPLEHGQAALVASDRKARRTTNKESSAAAEKNLGTTPCQAPCQCT
jgi:Outer membrane protein beta-barrel domain